MRRILNSNAALIFAMALAVVVLWILPARSSLWLDESLIAILTRHGFVQACTSGSSWGQSCVFSTFEWVWSHVFGASEIALRMPSILAGIATLFVLYRLGREFLDRASGLVFAAVYVALLQVAHQVPNARPYSLALLANCSALLFLLRGLRSGRFVHVLIWAVCSAIAIDLQFLFVVSLLSQIAFVAWLRIRERDLNLKHFAVALLIAAAVMIPVKDQVELMMREHNLLSLPDIPTVLDLGLALVTKTLVPVVLFALIRIRFQERVEVTRTQWDVALLGAFLLVPATVGFFILSHVPGFSLFLARYLLPCAPGVVLLWGSLVRRVEPAAIRNGSLVATLFLIVGLWIGRDLRGSAYEEDWRSAVRNAPHSGLIVYTDLVETRRLDWLDQPAQWEYLVAPILVYRPGVSRADTLLVPFDLGPQQDAYMQQRLADFLPQRSTVTLISRGFYSSGAWFRWLSQTLAADGFALTRNKHYGSVQECVFERVR